MHTHTHDLRMIYTPADSYILYNSRAWVRAVDCTRAMHNTLHTQRIIDTQADSSIIHSRALVVTYIVLLTTHTCVDSAYILLQADCNIYMLYTADHVRAM